MTDKTPLNVVLCWHMHQPDYRDHVRDEFQLPWVYLHAIKDYVDMAAHIEAVPGAKAVFNFSPVLLDQLAIYEHQIEGRLKDFGPIRDPLLAALDSPVFPADIEHRLALVKACLHSNQKRIIERFKAYQRLVHIADLVIHDMDSSSYVSNQYLADLVTWYHLAWLGETVRRNDERVKALIAQGSGFTLHQRRSLLLIIYELLSTLRSRYTRLVDLGQVELSTSPYAHPIIPLLLQFGTAREAMPGVRLPILEAYPNGRERACWHLQRGLEVFEAYFGRRPTGCWPSEGGISSATLEVIAEAGFLWTATGESVLRNSLRQSSADGHSGVPFHGSYKEQGSGLRLFVRNDTLSDLISFTYANWHADDAVADLVNRLVTVADACQNQKNAMVSIIMDGENAWEYYPENGYYFLTALYHRLVEHPRLKLTTYKDLLQTSEAYEIKKITAGSWVYGTFSTWIGDEDKNRAWDILGDVKHVYDECCKHAEYEPQLQRRINEQLAVCEGSDWFWWLGDYNPAATVSDFERLFRVHIANLYLMIGQEPPQYLGQIFAHGRGSPKLGGVIRPGSPDGST
ncbi:MAG: glycoside hydrolase [Gammaproteobacteria bacterium RBG_16_51_14]|nr:MAG: glycoside hydrolase [Gammaproteobacteria bacterium RBG_16_51_14]